MSALVFVAWKTKCIYVNKAFSPVPGLLKVLEHSSGASGFQPWASIPSFPVPRSAPYPRLAPECLVTFSSFPLFFYWYFWYLLSPDRTHTPGGPGAQR